MLTVAEGSRSPRHSSKVYQSLRRLVELDAEFSIKKPESFQGHKPLQNQTDTEYPNTSGIRRSNFQRRTGSVIERCLRHKGEKRVDLACCGERGECLVTSPLSLSWGKSSDTAYQAPTTFDCDVRRSASNQRAEASHRKSSKCFTYSRTIQGPEMIFFRWWLKIKRDLTLTWGKRISIL